MNSLLAAVRSPDPGRDEIVDDVLTLKGFEYIFNNIASVVLPFAGIILFIALISAGIKFITAGGEPAKIQSARNTLTFAIAGIVLIALSFLILKVIETLTGANVTEFRIFQP